jgi:hypothetical protein
MPLARLMAGLVPLPSVRALAEEYGVSPPTVSRAVRVLADEGRGDRGSGLGDVRRRTLAFASLSLPLGRAIRLIELRPGRLLTPGFSYGRVDGSDYSGDLFRWRENHA